MRKDFREIERELRGISSEFTTEDAPNVVKGQNFMTPSIAARRRLPDGTAVELSYGTGMSGEWIFGVTFRQGPHDSQLCTSLEQVRSVLKNVTEEAEDE